MRVETESIGGISGAAFTFEQRRAGGARAFLTVVARASFAIAPGAPMSLVAPPKLVAKPVLAEDGRLIEPGDLAPFLPHPEILILSSERPATPRMARLMVTRHGTKLLAKSMSIGPPNGAIALGPRLRVEPADVERLELPDGFDFRAYQTAPEDQWLPSLTGDESVVLDQVAPRLVRLQTWLPACAARARLYDGRLPLTDEFALRPDRLVIDLDAMRASMTFRACSEMAARPNLLAVIILDAAGQARVPFPPRALRGATPGQTLDDRDAGARRDEPPLPFVKGEAPPDVAQASPATEKRVAMGTMALEISAAALLASAPLPFNAPPPAVPRPPEPLVAPPEQLAPRRAHRPNAPTQIVSLKETLRDDSEGDAAPALPFRAGEAPATVAKPSEEKPRARSGGVTLMDMGAALPPQRALPFVVKPSAVGGAAAPDEDRSLGAHFLAALERQGHLANEPRDA